LYQGHTAIVFVSIHDFLLVLEWGSQEHND